MTFPEKKSLQSNSFGLYLLFTEYHILCIIGWEYRKDVSSCPQAALGLQRVAPDIGTGHGSPEESLERVVGH